ncbi:MAG TPA: Flp pilus assembly protein CpaB [Jiangellaceae bacterium]
MDDWRAQFTRWVRTIAWHRRLVAAALAAGAVALAVDAASPAPPETREVVVAARDLPGGTTLGEADLSTAQLSPGVVPDGATAIEDASGRVLAAPMRAGEPLTDVRLVGQALLDGWGPDVVASPVRVADAGAVGLLRPGDRIDLLATSADGTGATQVVAPGVPVLTLMAGGDVLVEGALLVVAATPDQAAALAGAAVTSRLSFTVIGS